MESKIHDKSINYQIKSIEILDFSLTSLDKPFEEIKNYNFDLNVTQKYNAEHKLIFTITTISVLDNKRKLLGSLKTNVIFEVLEFDSYLNKKTKKIDFPKEFVLTLNSVAISTSRGIMFSQFKGTNLHNVILPLVNMQKLLTDALIAEEPITIKQKLKK